MVIVIDFDNTIFEDNYPLVGELLPNARDVINRLYNDGDTIIISTCREGWAKENAIEALDMYGIKYHYFNENDPDMIAKYNNDSRKIGGDIYIEDKDVHTLLCGINWANIEHKITKIKLRNA